METNHTVVADITSLIEQAIDSGCTPQERVRAAMEACRQIAEHQIILVPISEIV